MPTNEQLAAARALRPGDPVIAMRSDGETLWVTYESGKVCTLGDPMTRAEDSFARPFQDGESKLTPEMLAQELARWRAQLWYDQVRAQRWALAEARHFEARLAGRATTFCDVDTFRGAKWLQGDESCSGDAFAQIIAQNKQPRGLCAKHARMYVKYFGAKHLDAD